MAVVRVIELLSESEESWEDAAREAIRRASQTLRDIRSVYIKEFEAVVEGDEVTRFRVNCKVSFGLEAGADAGAEHGAAAARRGGGGTRRR
jgi:flavin-binding protein dodecin